MQPDEAHKRASLACASWREDHIGKKTPRSLILLRRLRYQSATPVLSFPNRRKNAGKDRIGSSIEVSKHAVAAPRIRFSASAGEVATLAARDLSSGLAAMLGIEVGSSTDASLTQSGIRIDLGNSTTSALTSPIALEGDSFDVSRADGSIVIRAGTERALIHAESNLLEKLGARFPPGIAPLYPRIDADRLAALAPWRVTPAFRRRAFISDIMTWDYNFPD